MRRRTCMISHCPGALRWLPAFLVLSAACCFITPSFSDETKAWSDAMQSLLKVCTSRAEALRTFEGIVTTVEYGNRDLSRPNWADVRYYAVDRTRGWSLCEQRMPAVDGREATYRAYATVGDLWAIQDCSDGQWRVLPSPQRDYVSELTAHWLLQHQFPDGYVSHIADVVVTNEPFGGATCLHFEIEHLVEGRRAYESIWIDPDKGFAIVKLRLVLLRDGKPSCVSVNTADEVTRYTRDLWIPRRMERIECAVPEGQSKWVLVTRTVREVLQARVNEDLSEDVRTFFDPMPFSSEICTAPWKQRLADSADVEVPSPTEMTPMRVPGLLQELRDRLGEGPGDRQTIIDNALAEIPEALR